jgi:hypothetical protein
MQPTYYYFVRKHNNKEIKRSVGLGSRKRFQNSDNLLQSPRVTDKQELGIPRKGQGNGDRLFRNNKTGKKVFVLDISEDFPVTFLMGELSVPEFRLIASELTPQIQLLEVDSSWEGKPTTIVVAMTEEQVRNMFGRKTKMRKLAVHRASP